MEDSTSILIYDETLKYFEENNLKPSEHLDFVHFRLEHPVFDLEKALLSFNLTYGFYEKE